MANRRLVRIVYRMKVSTAIPMVVLRDFITKTSPEHVKQMFAPVLDKGSLVLKDYFILIDHGAYSMGRSSYVYNPFGIMVILKPSNDSIIGSYRYC